MKNSYNKALPRSMYPLTVTQPADSSSDPGQLDALKISAQEIVGKTPMYQTPYQVHQMVKEEGNWDESWFNSYE